MIITSAVLVSIHAVSPALISGMCSTPIPLLDGSSLGTPRRDVGSGRVKPRRQSDALWRAAGHGMDSRSGFRRVPIDGRLHRLTTSRRTVAHRFATHEDGVALESAPMIGSQRAVASHRRDL